MTGGWRARLLAGLAALVVAAGCAAAPRPRLAPETPPLVAEALLQMPASNAATESALVDRLLGASDDELLYMLGMVGTPGSDDDRLARYAVASLVAHTGAPGHAPQRQRLERLLGEAMLRARAAEPRNFYASQLQLVGTAASVPALAELLAAEATAATAIGALTAIGGEMAAARMRAELEAGSSQAAALALGLARLGDALAVAPVLRLLSDDNPEVRLAALRAAAEIAPPTAVASLRDAAMGFSGADRARASFHLIRYAERLRDEGATQVGNGLLEQLAQQDNPAVREAAGRLLQSGARQQH